MLRSLLAGLVFVTSVGASCPGSLVPHGEVVRTFAPIGAYGGHWGADIAMPKGSLVRSAMDGIVSFAGVVAGVRTVTIQHAGSLRTSYSYLSSIGVSIGDEVPAGAVIAKSGGDHGIDALHFSARVSGRYVDPMKALSCASGVVRLVPFNP